MADLQEVLKELPENNEERKKFYKMLLDGMSLDMKIDELDDSLSDEILITLREQFTEDEDYEICQAFQYVIDKRKSGKISN